VIQAAFQEFHSPGGGGVLEIHGFSFRSPAAAARFIETSCLAEGGTVSKAGGCPICVFPGGSTNRALVRKGTEVFDLALYGTSALDPIGGLVKAFGRVRARPAPTQ
jgi:hypothetical protein